MLVSGDKKSKQISLDICPVFFRVVSELVQALVMTYNETLQALVVEGDVLLLKPFLDPAPPPVKPQLGPLGLSCV
jgi:hypothetical protein